MTRHEDAAGVRIRRTTPFDAALFAALHQSCFATGEQSHQQRAWDEAAMAQFIAGPSTLCLLATVGAEDAQPAGFLIARAAGDEAELLTIGVVADLRKRGVGRALLRHAAEALKSSGIRALFLEVDETNATALALYRQLGAEAVGRRPGYYEDGGDAAVLRLDLQS
ncbi:GNAT family N-acetyltransferase [Methyloceanibacter sp. wino2]|uniref:GNAT family N-acetyltransferase n=1 Tax=Methyloceanibacter sp. wino2 TaxID=2170729 RepID=UPI000D3E3E9A|nr:GNAT family N-acetyltransferase [Methyloceanibacter sp. wino2]